jgi:Ni,Fe-hydrogenase III large subunit/Ni,Fe-hydrogenase III component G
MVPRSGAADWVTHMIADLFGPTMRQLPSNMTCGDLKVDAVHWRRVAEELNISGGRFLTLWGSDDRDRDGRFRVYAVYLLPQNVLVLEHEIEDAANPTYPSLAPVFPSALRLERATHDLLAIASTESDKRGWLRHGGWPDNVFPLRRDVDRMQPYPVTSAPYAFLQVEGDGVHEIAVGPVHAGTIEPGHFRFSVVGEKVLRLEQRLGYTHKGVAKRFEGMLQNEGHRLAARLSGDSAVAFSWAYCAALEAITQIACPPRATSLRALALEHERLANHLGDLGALGNDAGFAFGLTQFSHLKEDLLRTNVVAFGARYLMDYILPGGIALDLPDHAPRLLRGQYSALERASTNLRSIYDEHGGLQDRFREAGRLEHGLAAKLGAIGLVGRASGISCDLRVDHPWAPYDRLNTRLVTHTSGDVAARVLVRFDEISESLRLCRALVEELSPGPIRVEIFPPEPGRLGIGLIEGWRGPVMIALETGRNGAIRRCHAHDPSWQNWPLLEYAILGNIVPDFPLINKSFNLSYSGHDG